jgi:hypothetical protein
LEEAEESTQATTIVELCESSRVPPIPESESVMKRITAKHCDKSENNKANDENDLAKGSPELSLPIPFYSKNIDSAILQLGINNFRILDEKSYP